MSDWIEGLVPGRWTVLHTYAIECENCGDQFVVTAVNPPDLPDGWSKWGYSVLCAKCNGNDLGSVHSTHVVEDGG